MNTNLVSWVFKFMDNGLSNNICFQVSIIRVQDELLILFINKTKCSKIGVEGVLMVNHLEVLSFSLL